MKKNKESILLLSRRCQYIYIMAYKYTVTVIQLKRSNYTSSTQENLCKVAVRVVHFGGLSRNSCRLINSWSLPLVRLLTSPRS